MEHMVSLFRYKHFKKLSRLIKCKSKRYVSNVQHNNSIFYFSWYHFQNPALIKSFSWHSPDLLLNASISGELSRTFPESEILKHIAHLQIFAMITNSIGPLSPIFFQWVDFKLFGMEINQYNAIGLFMVFVTIIYQIITYFFLTNLTKEPGYQIFLRTQGAEDQNSNTEKPKEKLLSIKEMLINYDIDHILLEVLIASVMFSQFEVGINLIALTKFSWSINFLGAVTFIGISIAAILMKGLSRLNSLVDVNYLFAILLTIYSVLSILMTFPLTLKFGNKALEVCLIIILSSLSLVAGFNIRILSSSLLFMLVPLHSRCFIIGVRQSILKLSMGFSFFAASFMFDYGSIAYSVLSIICLIMSIIRLLRSPGFLKKYVR